jgi:cytidylate kinase
MIEVLVEPVKNLKRIRVAIVNQSENAFEFNQRLMETYSRIAVRGYPSRCDISKYSRFIFTSINDLESLVRYYPDITVIVIKGSTKEVHPVLNDSRFLDEKSKWHLFSDCLDFQQCFADVCMTISKEMRKYIIGYDGWAGSGKGAISTIVGNNFKEKTDDTGKTIDTGKLYRIVAYELGVKKRLSTDRSDTIEVFDHVFKNFSLDDYPETSELRSAAVNDIVSLWSELPTIREKLFWVFMKEIHGCDESVVGVEGRDVTTFLCRTGLSNWFVVCILGERARRRNLQNNLGIEENIKSLSNRDKRDGSRTLRPCYFDSKFAKELDNHGVSPNGAASIVITHSTDTIVNWKREIYLQDNELQPENRIMQRTV